MLKLKEIIRLNTTGLSQQQIARSLKISVGAVHKYLHLAQDKGLTWTQAEGMTEKVLREHERLRVAHARLRFESTLSLLQF